MLANVLSKTLKQAQRGIGLGDAMDGIRNLQFAYDTLLSSSRDPSEALVLKEILIDHERATGFEYKLLR